MSIKHDCLKKEYIEFRFFESPLKCALCYNNLLRIEVCCKVCKKKLDFYNCCNICGFNVKPEFESLIESYNNQYVAIIERKELQE